MNKSRKLDLMTLLIPIAILLLKSSAFTQGHPNYTLEAECAEKAVPGETIQVRAELSPKLTDKLKDMARYSWSVSAGTIESGQGTERITIATEKAHAGSSLTAQVEVSGGFYFQSLNASCSTALESLPEAILLGETGIANVGRAERMIDELFEKLSAEPSARGVAAIYAPTAAARNRSIALVKARIRARAFDRSRIAISNGGNAKAATLQFWVVPAGADDPELKLSVTK